MGEKVYLPHAYEFDMKDINWQNNHLQPIRGGLTDVVIFRLLNNIVAETKIIQKYEGPSSKILCYF